jgi:hypothetical protein
MSDPERGEIIEDTARRERGFSAADWALFAVLCLFLAFLFREALFLDQAVLSFDSRLWPPFSAHAPDGLVAKRADMIHPDLPCWMLPERIISVEMMRNGTPPLWTPYTLGGMPLLGNLAFPVFYPVNLLLHGILDVDPLRAVGYQAVLNLAVTCLGMMLFLQSLRLGRIACFMGALCLSTSAWYLTHLYIPIFLNAAAWIPFMLWTGERIFQQRRAMLHAFILALAVGASSLGGFPQITILGLYGTVFWVLVRALLQRMEAGSRFWARSRTIPSGIRTIPWPITRKTPCSRSASWARRRPASSDIPWIRTVAGDFRAVPRTFSLTGFISIMMCRITSWRTPFTSGSSPSCSRCPPYSRFGDPPC